MTILDGAADGEGLVERHLRAGCSYETNFHPRSIDQATVRSVAGSLMTDMDRRVEAAIRIPHVLKLHGDIDRIAEGRRRIGTQLFKAGSEVVSALVVDAITAAAGMVVASSRCQTTQQFSDGLDVAWIGCAWIGHSSSLQTTVSTWLAGEEPLHTRPADRL
ncbi:hypothetical protein OZ411_41515 [Bradyrhizobium sp. Arg237L]|uniref:hypothetical protein n=1 Tax=Bradyrhizobium sp. Arg237L TaxID=3003352 RepID=UPI00249E098D|nr:hypothetical protein [Bradyrhizobium sp. Arg237L]MDI4239273.1 hypothetical protein [Bradyrhizobium sp. Arg237L]